VWAAYLPLIYQPGGPGAGLYVGVTAILAFFGVIHSAMPDGNMYLPWLIEDSFLRAVPFQLGLSYLLLGGLVLLLSLVKSSRQARPTEH
jgi:hypothetical protein